MTAPHWLADEPWLRDLLHWFVDRLDGTRERAITRRIKKATCPALFRFDEDTRYRWQLVERLATEHAVFTIHYDTRIAPFQERYENAQLRLDPAAEPLLRAWLDRPRIDPLRAAWHSAISERASHFYDGGAALLAAMPGVPDRTPGELVAAFVTVGRILEQGLSLREISARCFGGDSKFLDQRQELLARLFGERAGLIQPRPLLLTAWAPTAFSQLLIVENQDSFLRLADNPPSGCALIYSGGFRASADRLRSAHTRFAFLPGSDAGYFSQHWLKEQLPVFFWGDLDFAGLAILAALRQSLPQLVAWQPGYRPMLQHLLEGGGHSAGQARKTGQVDPGESGCDYTDRHLLPALRRLGRFLDQEAVNPLTTVSPTSAS